MNKNEIVKTCVLSVRTGFFLLILLILTGCAASPSTNKSNPESSNLRNPAFSQTEHSPNSSESLLKIIVYTDFQCGACSKFNVLIEPELRKQYIDTSKARIEIRLLGALGIDSVNAAKAALCAAEQGQFLKYQDALFSAWREENYDAYSLESLTGFAVSLGFDDEAFIDCFTTNDEAKKAILEINMEMAKADDVNTLPAVIINGVKIEGYKPLKVYIQAIERELAKRPSQ